MINGSIAMADSTEKKKDKKRGYQVSFWAVTLVVLAIILLVPIAVIDLFDNVIKPSEDSVYSIAADVPPAPAYSRMHLDVLALDEVQKLATVRVSGFHFCAQNCDYKDKVIFYSISADGKGADGLPPSESITLPATSGEFGARFQLPIASNLIRYPFDRSALAIGVVLQRISADNKTTTVLPAEAKNQLFVTLQEQIPRVKMNRPKAIDPQTVQPTKVKADYIYVSKMEFYRPVYLKILVVFIVLLITIAAIYAAILRPFDQLIINAGALVLGIYGIRSLTVGSYPTDTTIVDILLTAVAFFLLCTIAVRGMGYLHLKGGLHLPGLPREQKEEEKTRKCPQCLSDVPLEALRCAHCTASLPPVEEPALPLPAPLGGYSAPPPSPGSQGYGG